MSTSLATYRALIPAHSAIADATVEVYLELAAKRHDATRWGVVYAEAMCFWAAHTIERTPGLGGATSAAVGPVTARSAGKVSESYGSLSGNGGSTVDQDLMTTVYGLRYIDIRNTRAASCPTTLVAGAA